MLVFVFKLLSRLPLSVVQALGGLLGRLVYLLGGRYAQRLRDHMDLDGDSVTRVFVSALTGEGLAELRQALADVLARDRPAEPIDTDLDPEMGVVPHDPE